jgi:hypothetical protein
MCKALWIASTKRERQKNQNQNKTKKKTQKRAAGVAQVVEHPA